MTTNHELQNTLSTKCGFLVTVEDGIAWPNTSDTPAAIRALRLQKLAAVLGTTVSHGMYVRIPTVKPTSAERVDQGQGQRLAGYLAKARKMPNGKAITAALAAALSAAEAEITAWERANGDSVPA